MYEFGTTIEKIRFMKNISVRVLVDGIMSISQYSRYKTGQNSLSVSKLFALIDRLNVTFEEFMFIHEKTDPNSFKHLQDQLMKAFSEKDIVSLRQIAEQAQSQFEQTTTLKNQQLAITADLLATRIKQEPFSSQQKMNIHTLSLYLFNLNMWTHYDIVLFNNNIYAFSNEDRQLFSKNILKNLKNYKEYIQNKSEYVFFIANLLVIAINTHQYRQVSEYIDILNNLKLDPMLTTEKLIITFFKGIQEYLEKPGKPLDTCLMVLDIIKKLELTQLQLKLGNVVDVLKQNTDASSTN